MKPDGVKLSRNMGLILIMIGLGSLIWGTFAYMSITHCTIYTCEKPGDILSCCVVSSTDGTFCKAAPAWSNTSECSVWSQPAVVGGIHCDIWGCVRGGELATAGHRRVQGDGILDVDGAIYVLAAATLVFMFGVVAISYSYYEK